VKKCFLKKNVVYCKLLFSVHVAFNVLWGVAVFNQQLAT